MPRAKPAPLPGDGRSHVACPAWLTIMFAALKSEEQNDFAKAALNELRPVAVAGLIELLRHPNFEIRRDAADALAWIKEVDRSAIPALLESLRDPHYEVRAKAAFVLGSMREAASTASQALINALRDPDDGVRENVAWAIGCIGPSASGAVSKLMSILKNKKDRIWRTTAWAVGCMGSAATPAVPLLAKSINYPDDGIRLASIKALGRIGPPAASAVPHLMRFYWEGWRQARLEIVNALGGIGPSAAPAIPVLAKALRDYDEHWVEGMPFYDLQQGAADALLKIGAVAAPTLAVALEAGSNDFQDRGKNLTRQHAARVLDQMATTDPEVVKVLFSCLNDSDINTRTSVASALARVMALLPLGTHHRPPEPKDTGKTNKLVASAEKKTREVAQRQLHLVRICLDWPEHEEVSYPRLMKKLMSEGVEVSRGTVMNDVHDLEGFVCCKLIDGSQDSGRPSRFTRHAKSRLALARLHLESVVNSKS